MGNKVRNLITSFVAIGLALAMLIVGAPTALAARVVDRNVTAGVQTSPDTSWLNKVSGCTKYVAGGGSDTTGTGASDKPWKTIKVGASKLQPADTLCVQPGSYHEANIVPAVLGTSAKPIAIKALGKQGDVKILPAINTPATPAISEDPFFTLVTNAPVTEIGYLLVDNFAMDKQKHDGPGFYLLGSGNGVHHVAIQHNVIMNSKANAGITVRARSHNILIKKNIITGHSRWVLPNEKDPQYVRSDPMHRRYDANGISIEGTDLPKSVETVLIEGNTMKNNGGDGIQCLGVDDTKAYTGDPIDIDILDNKVQNDAGSAAVEENGFDIKSCNRVSIRGRTPNAGEALGQNSKISELLPTTSSLDWGKDLTKPGTNNASGDAIVIHFYARNILIENTRIFNVCNGILVGRSDIKVTNVIIRRTLIFKQRYKQKATNGAAADADRCRGRGIQISNADNVDIYHNTLDGVPTTALQVGDSGAPVSSNVDIWNNIFVLSKSVGAEPRWWINIVKENNNSNIDSDYNVFWHEGGTTAGDNHFAITNSKKTLKQWQDTDRDIKRTALPRSAWASPQFVPDPASNDYFTQPGSPPRDAALNNTGSTYCQVRPDIGFLESCTTT